MSAVAQYVLHVFSISLFIIAVISTRQYEVGQTYSYLLRSDTFLNDASSQLGQKTGRQIGYGFEAKAKLTTLWKDLQTPLNRIVEIDLENAHLTVTPADKQ